MLRVPISRETLRGYVLEELLAKLIQNTGYRLLADASQDPAELENQPNGLAVRGRGAVHQVDVLGELLWIPEFTFPIRLVVEAKARGGRCGIDVVRNAVGVVSDVNQHLVRGGAGTSDVLRQHFTYRYALFSTSGFSPRAAEYALAHQISLIDLSTGDFLDVVTLADEIAAAFYMDGDSPSRAGGFIRWLRARLRVQLGTWPAGVPRPSDDVDPIWQRAWDDLRGRVDAIGELFVGMANGPYLLVLRARDTRRVIQALDQHPVQRVSINWTLSVPGAERWTVTLHDTPEPLELTFALPAPVAAWIFDRDADARRRALAFKQQLLSTITIYRFVDRRDRLYRLEYSPDQVAAERGGQRRC
jgi:hypothetical protein